MKSMSIKRTFPLRKYLNCPRIRAKKLFPTRPSTQRPFGANIKYSPKQDQGGSHSMMSTVLFPRAKLAKKEVYPKLSSTLSWEINPPEHRLPLSDVTDLITPSTNSKTSNVTKYKIEYRKRTYEEEFVILKSPNIEMKALHEISNRTPPDSMRLRPDVLCNQQTPGTFKYRRRISDQPPIDYFKEYPIPLEVVRKMFSYLNKKDMSSAMQTCKFFYNAGSTCDNWDFMDFHKRQFDMSVLNVLNRRVLVCRMSDCRISPAPVDSLTRLIEPNVKPFLLHLTHLDLGRAEFLRIEDLALILSGCTQLKGLCLEGIDFKHLGTEIGRYIGQNKQLQYLDFSLTKGLTPKAFEFIVSGCESLLELNLSWCGLDEESVKVLVQKLPISLKKLNISGTKDKKSISNHDVNLLVVRCPNLEELDLSDNISLEDGCIDFLASLELLHTLSLNRCYSISPNKFLNFKEISVLNVFGTMADQGLRDLQDRMIHTRVNAEVLSSIAKPTVPPSVSSIWQQRTRDFY